MTVEQFIWTIIINVISIIIGGGLISLWIDWRRHKRETMQWELQDQQLQIHIPKAEIAVTMWQITENTNKDTELLIHRNELENTVQDITVVTEFVIRNTTNAEIIITSYDVNVLNTPSGRDEKRFYTLDTRDLISVEDIGAVKLRPLATLSNFVLIESKFGKGRRLESAPTTVSVEATTDSGNKIQQTATLNVVKFLPSGIEWAPDGVLHPKQYIERAFPDAAEEEDDIPF